MDRDGNHLRSRLLLWFDQPMNIAIIGGGPAGLRAAEVAAQGAAHVTLFDAKPSVGRKFLVAGRGGLNLTKEESPSVFATRYHGPEMPEAIWNSLLEEFDSASLRAWANELGVETFVASTGRVYPKQLKASVLLRRWVKRLRNLGVIFKMNHRWSGLEQSGDGKLLVKIQTGGAGSPALEELIQADRIILALGGASWPETGSDGSWVPLICSLGVEVNPLTPANCGWEFPWTDWVLTIAEGKPLKNVVVTAGEKSAAGELLVTRYGLEGGALYQVGPELRANGELSIDFKPTFTAEQLAAKLDRAPTDLLAHAAKRWRLCSATVAIIRNCAAPCATARELANLIKQFRLHLTGPRPLAEAISSAGGICWRELDSNLMLKRLPGVFVAGEMIDWEAPTGGYLLQGCFSTGTRAAKAALSLRI